MVFFFQWCTQMYVRLKRGLATFEFYFPKRTVSQLTYNLWRRTKCVSDFAWSHYILTAVFIPHRADILRCVFSIAYLRMQKGNKKVYYNTQYAVQTHNKIVTNSDILENMFFLLNTWMYFVNKLPRQWAMASVLVYLKDWANSILGKCTI